MSCFPKTNEILGGIDACQLSRLDVVGSTTRPSNVDGSQMPTQVPDLMLEWKLKRMKK